MATPVLSFVVPAYNEERYLRDCLRSIVAQTRGIAAGVEIVVVNNASTDGTRTVAAEFAEVRVVDEPRKGLTFAREAGFRASTGALIANVDADARLTPGWVDLVLETFAQEPNLAALSGPLVYYDLAPRQRAQVQMFYGIAYVTYLVNRWVLRVGSMMQGGNFVVRRSALEAIGGFNTAIRFYGEDTDLARRVHKVGRTRFTMRMKMYSSARRLKHEGLFTMAARYSVNYLCTTFLKRPYTDDSIDVREESAAVEG